MKLAIGCDHAGFELKTQALKWLQSQGHDVHDLGTHSTQPVDYPDFAAKVAQAVASGQVERGIVICGSGVGACVAANKVKGARASVCHDTYSAHQGVEHDDLNCLVLGARVVGLALAEELMHAFLAARFTNEERHVRRLQKISQLEQA